MSRRSFVVLLLIIAVLGAIVIGNRETAEAPADTELLAGLAAALNAVDSVTIRAAGGRVVATLERGESQWGVTEHGGYPADVGRIRRNLIALSAAQVIERKTSDPGLYARLGVGDIAGEDADGLELTIESPGETWRIIIGQTGVRGDNAYARIPGQAESWLIAANLDLGRESTDWLESIVIDIPPADISSVTTVHPDNHTVRIRNTEGDGFEPIDVPADVAITPTGVADSIGAVLSALRLTDVRPADAADAGRDDPVVTRFETFAGLEIAASVYTEGDRRLVGFAFSATDEAQASRAGELNGRLGGWLFRIPDYKLDHLIQRREDLYDPAE